MKSRRLMRKGIFNELFNYLIRTGCVFADCGPTMIVPPRPAKRSINSSTFMVNWYKPVLFMGYMDVVPVVDVTITEWTRDPFAGTIADLGVFHRIARVSGFLLACQADFLLDSAFNLRPLRPINITARHLAILNWRLELVRERMRQEHQMFDIGRLMHLRDACKVSNDNIFFAVDIDRLSQIASGRHRALIFV